VSICLIGIGANQGDRRANIRAAESLLRQQPGVCVVRSSRLIETPAATGQSAAPAFLNGVIRVETSRSPSEMLAILQQIEHQLGRVRDKRWDVRPIDLDILLFDDLVIRSPELEIPHPRMTFRRFVLQPAATIAPEMIHRPTQLSIQQLCEHLDETDRYVAITGTTAMGVRDLARIVSQQSGARLITDAMIEGVEASDSGSPAWERQIESCDNRMQTLIRPVDAGPEAWFVSDFWIEQAWVDARCELDDESFTRFASNWEQASANILRPRLLVIVDEPSSASHIPLDSGDIPVGPWSSETPPAVSRRWRSLFWAQATRPGRGPLLRLDEPDVDRAAEEVTAAIQAMQ